MPPTERSRRPPTATPHATRPATTDPATAKVHLRRRLLAARRRLAPATRQRLSRLIVHHLVSTPQLRAGLIAAYAPLPAEVQVEPLLAALARTGRLVLPRLRGEELEWHRVPDLGRLATGQGGVREPRPTGQPVDVRALHAALVPAVALDLHGRRLGRGGGHIDRFLDRLPCATRSFGIAFGAQLVAAVPVLGHDRGVDAVVTERGVVRVRS